jgi:hypothetical protein
MRCHLLIFIILKSVPLIGFAYEEMVSSKSDYELCVKEISCHQIVPINVECSYPNFKGSGVLIDYVNNQLKSEAENWLDCFLKEELCWDEDERTLGYSLLPAYQAADLISIYGAEFQGIGCRGCTYYQGLTFWQNGDLISKISLEDFFIKESSYLEFLLNYCQNYFNTSFPQFPFEADRRDLDAFILTDTGLMFFLRAYRISGWADGPDTFLVPYSQLKNFIDPHGPLRSKLL